MMHEHVDQNYAVAAETGPIVPATAYAVVAAIPAILVLRLSARG